ncbi:MAG: hypothetical protein H7A53_07775 [Akkermansiaceae bacterium]|nr:hypothetical protein [Akkermansiaceae bacterium]
MTEDNEPGITGHRPVPIITATINSQTTGQNITEEVRYLIDQSDPSARRSGKQPRNRASPALPTILRDDTIRLEAAFLADRRSIEGWTKLHPRVNESTVDTIARVPNGHCC